MFMEIPTSNCSSRSSGAKRPAYNAGNIALRWSAGHAHIGFYRHLAPLEPEPLLGCGVGRAAEPGNLLPLS
jgi:hypothetical protein